MHAGPRGSHERRKSPRTEMLIRTNIYKIDQVKPNMAGELLISETVANDLSATGVCLLSDEKVDLQDGQYFVLEFPLAGKVHFLYAKLARTGDCVRSALFKYYYAFSFESDPKRHRFVYYP